jgi:hypothetical protein
MIILVLVAMFGTTKIVTPYIDTVSHRWDTDRYQTLSLNLILNTGQPTDWGQTTEAPTAFGLAKAGNHLPYELDPDKLTRLNMLNAFSVPYHEVWGIVGEKDLTFQIKIQPVFTVNATLTAAQPNGATTNYQFHITTDQSGKPIATQLSGYLIAGDFLVGATALALGGSGELTFSVPSSYSGSVAVVCFAQSNVDARMCSFTTFNLDLDSLALSANGSFAQLSPLNGVLYADFSEQTTVQRAVALTFGGNSTLTAVNQTSQHAEYALPDLPEAGPIALVVAGNNGTASGASWVMYPQVPLQIGADFDNSVTGAKTAAQTYVVTCNGALYQATVTWGGLA